MCVSFFETEKWMDKRKEREIDLKVNNNKKKTITQMYKPQNKIENNKKKINTTLFFFRPFFNDDLSVYFFLYNTVSLYSIVQKEKLHTL